MSSTPHDDEIELRPYIQLILQHWWQIGVFAALVAVLALVFSLLQTRQYEATAIVLLTRSRPQLSLAQQFPTVSDPSDMRTRSEAAQSLANSSSIILELIEEAKTFASPALLENYDAFREHLTITTKGDMLLLTAAVDSPQVAEKIANRWAELTVSSINAAYAEQQPVAEIQTQVDQARQAYETAQGDLEAYLRTDNSHLLSAQVEAMRRLVSDMAVQQTGMLRYYAERALAMQTLADQANALKAQLEAENGSTTAQAGDVLAVLYARATAFGLRPLQANTRTQSFPGDSISTNVPSKDGETSILQTSRAAYILIPQEEAFDLQVSLNELTALAQAGGNLSADLDTLVRLASQEQVRMETALADMAAQSTATSTDTPITLTAIQLQTLQAELETQTAQKLQLTSQRDLTFSVYKALTEKEAEVRQQIQTARYANLASMASVPSEPLPRGTVRNTLIGGILGAILATFWLLVLNWWRTTPPAQVKEPIQEPIH